MSITPGEPQGWYDEKTGEWDRAQPSRLSTDPASLPYAGTSGWSGSNTSRERATERDADGRTASIQARIVDNAAHAGAFGVTIAWLRDAYPDEHHGTLSGALTALHKTGRLLRLTEKRDKCSVYVHPRFLLGREAVPPKTPKKIQEVVVDGDTDRHLLGALVAAALEEHDEVRVRRTAR